MYLQTKEEIKQHIGSKSLFKKIPQTEAVLNYVSGIQELTFERNSGKPVGRFFIAQYPYGILIADRKGKFRFGIPFTDLKNIEISKLDEEYYEIALGNSSHSSSVVFSFQKKDRLRVLPLVKALPVKEEKDPRDEKIAREEILKLKEEFAADYFTDRRFFEELKGAEGLNRDLQINEKYISYRNRTLDISSVTGYAVGIEEVERTAFSRFHYSIRINHAEENLYIYFTSTSTFLKEGEYSAVLNEIGRVLFDVVSRPIVAKWFDKFANDETIDSKVFTLSRQGMLLKTQTPNIMIHWDEIAAQPNGLYRWPYKNTVFLKLDGSYDHRDNMLSTLVHWLQEDPQRLMALMGRTYYVS
ncbi:MAG: hypothetical protein A3D31_06615 [Candidatus Fluviicola riflensis]|nr:MAG: hypothetical protein CHH17_08395 [Candidatus Fluviicola riflensis]OGS79632.1 MAG: hypothetical protein A3D31_06615 [Candidatus Fluviicola riflensis]OGS87063.1 MAG: hypothetical protein A2724_06075 [Fluviicola sp. RIFCSPHIGHO2_01_FULL_43_53]OGS89855.1 MAG: hypothetical protein A3E30_02825 [Fluviicola sp. RIFCSPHIGHO2_12_FULL_43_24]